MNISLSSNASSINLNTANLNATHQDSTYTDLAPLLNYTVTVANTGSIATYYSVILFANTTNAGPAPFPKKRVVGFDRVASIAPGQSASLTMEVIIGSMARYDESGNAVLYPGAYELALNNERAAVFAVIVDGEEMLMKECVENQSKL